MKWLLETGNTVKTESENKTNRHRIVLHNHGKDRDNDRVRDRESGWKGRRMGRERKWQKRLGEGERERKRLTDKDYQQMLTVFITDTHWHPLESIMDFKPLELWWENMQLE